MQSARISQKILAVRVIHCGAIHAGAGGVQSSVKSHSAGVIASVSVGEMRNAAR